MNHPLGSYIKRFFSHYLPVQKGLSVNTILAYRDAVKLLLCHAADTVKIAVDELAVEDLSEKIVLGFLDHLEQIRGCSTITRNARLAAIRSLFEYIAGQEPVLLVHCAQIRAIPLKRAEHKTVDYLNEIQMQAVLDTVDVNSRTGMRDMALLMLLYNTGARVSEIVTLDLDDLRLDDSPQVRLIGKGRKQRACPLWDETVTLLNSYLQQRAPKQPGTQQVFLNANGAPITRFGIRYITRKYGAQAQVKQPDMTAKRVNPHTIRHYAASRIMPREVSSPSVFQGKTGIEVSIRGIIRGSSKRSIIRRLACSDLVEHSTAWFWQGPVLSERG